MSTCIPCAPLAHASGCARRVARGRVALGAAESVAGGPYDLAQSTMQDAWGVASRLFMLAPSAWRSSFLQFFFLSFVVAATPASKWGERLLQCVASYSARDVAVSVQAFYVCAAWNWGSSALGRQFASVPRLFRPPVKRSCIHAFISSWLVSASRPLYHFLTVLSRVAGRSRDDGRCG